MNPLFTLSPAAQQHMAQALQSSGYTRPVWYMGLKEIGALAGKMTSKSEITMPHYIQSIISQ